MISIAITVALINRESDYCLGNKTWGNYDFVVWVRGESLGTDLEVQD